MMSDGEHNRAFPRNRRARWRSAALWWTIACAATGHALGVSPARSETPPSHGDVITAFDAARPSEHPLSNERMLVALSQDERVIACMKDSRSGQVRPDPSAFVAYRYDLNGDGRDEWIIKASGNPCLTSPDVARWWIYEEVTPDDGGDPLDLVLSVDAGEIEVLSQRRFGYANLRGRDVAHRGEDHVFLYDGDMYKPTKS